MNVNVHVFLHDEAQDQRIMNAIGELFKLLRSVAHNQDIVRDLVIKTQVTTEKIMATLDEVLADVADESTKIDSLSTLVAGIKAQLDAILAGGISPEVQAKVDALFAGIEANKAKVQAAIDTNTTAAP